MTITIGRFSTTEDLANLVTDGDRISFTFDLVGSSVDEMKAYRQQLLGLVDNDDEEIVPFTWSDDSTFDGFYRPISVQVGSSEVMLSTGAVMDGARVVLERVTGYANPWFEVTASSVVRTNAHGITAPDGIVATRSQGGLANSEYDLRPVIKTYVSSTAYSVDPGVNLYVIVMTAPVAATSMRTLEAPDNFYVGACTVEVKYGSSWYTVIGRAAPRSTVWRISNGRVRLTSADGATSGTIEVWNGSAWESNGISHTNNLGVVYGIGYGTAGDQSTVSVLRNSPEQVTVKCAGANADFTYSIQRGARIVTSTATAAVAERFGLGLTVGAAGADFGQGVRSNADANGNYIVFGTAAAYTANTANTRCHLATAATSDTAWVGVDLNASGAASDMADEFLAACSWRQRIVTR